MEYTHTQKNMRITPRKLREVVYLIKGKDPREILEILPHVEKKAAGKLLKVLKTAIANAEQNGAEGKELVLKEIQVNEGSKLKRFRAGARGRAKPYKKRWSHLRITLALKEEVKTSKSKKETKASKTKKTAKKEVKKVEKKTKKVTKKKGAK